MRLPLGAVREVDIQLSNPRPNFTDFGDWFYISNIPTETDTPVAQQ